MAGYENVPDYEIKRQIVEVAHMLNEKGLVGTHEGNISVRKGDKVYETPSSHSKELLTEGQIICVDLDGNQLEGELAPTSETPMHTKCYQLRDDINAVVHAHPPIATAWAQAGRDVVCEASPEFQIMYGGKVPCLRFGRPGTTAIIEELPLYINDYDIVLLGNHGVLAVGPTPQEAFAKISGLEMLLETIVTRKIMFPDAECDLDSEALAMLEERYTQKFGKPFPTKRG